MDKENDLTIDQGEDFGKWDDQVSRMLYHTSTKEILNRIYIPNTGRIIDVGGANGLMREFIPDIVTLDYDMDKNPDIVADIRESKVTGYKLAILRYVLHYMNDYDVIRALENLDVDNILIIQFTNEDLISKYKNSVNELKYFRTASQLEALLPGYEKIYSKEYIVTAEFYKNRLRLMDGSSHFEAIGAYYK